jgi:CRISPR-associated protein Cmr4
MPKLTKAYFLHALSPLHVGSGRGAGFIDLPVMREKVTNWPLVPGSSIRGVLADYHKATEDERKKIGATSEENKEISMKKAAFGLSDDDGVNADNINSGSLVFTDARLICLPIRSFYGTFAWVTSSMVLHRFKRDLEMAGLVDGLIVPAETEKILLPEGSESVIQDDDSNIYLEDLDFSAQPDTDVAKWAKNIAAWCFPGDDTWQHQFRKRFALIPNGSFDFLSKTGTEVNAHIRIKQETKTVERGALWYEECLPAETILAGLVWCDRVFPKGVATSEDLMREYCSGEMNLQMGGKATTGKGMVRCLFTEGGINNGHS